MRKKHLGLCCVLFSLAFLLCLDTADAITVTFGEDITITDLSEAMNTDEVWATNGQARIRGNTAYVSITANSGEGKAYYCQDFDWDFGAYPWDKIKDESIHITFSFSYTMSVPTSQTSDAHCAVNVHTLPGQTLFNDTITEGTKSNTVMITGITSLENFRATFGVGCRAEDGGQGSYARLTVTSVKIEFPSVPQEPIIYEGDDDGGNPSDSDPPKGHGEPVNIVNGNMYLIKTDLATAAPGIPFAFIRAYNSIHETDGPLGMGWTHNFNIHLTPPEDDTSPALIRDGDGTVITFAQISPNVFWTPAGEYSLLTMTGSDFVWEKKNKIRYTFNSEGILQSIQDRNGNIISLSYDGNDQLTTITDTAGRNYQLNYDATGYITSLADPTGRTVSYQYDANGNLSEVTDPAGGKTVYEYNDPNDLHNITKQTVNNSFVYTYSYDDQDRCIHAAGVTGELGNGFEYHPDESYTVVTDSKGYILSKYYNEYGRVTRIVYPDGSEELFTWDGNLNRTAVSRQDGAIWQYEYNKRGNITEITDPLGGQQVIAYDEDGNLTSWTDELGRTTPYEYDANGNLLRISYPLGTADFTYNSRGQVLNFTEPEGNTFSFAYDAEGNLTSITDPEGNSVSYTYDAIGHKVSERDARGNTTHYQYDALSRMIKVIDALGGQIDTTHEVAGLGSLTDPKSNTTTFQYDALNQLVSMTDPLGHTEGFSYDANGNLTTRLDPNGNTITYSYDDLNRLTTIQYPDGSQVAFAYDAIGRLTQMTDDSGTSAYTYDDLGRLTAYNGVMYTYDAAGNLRTLTYPGGKTVTYTYDDQNRLVQMTDWVGRQTVYSYNLAGLVTNIALPNGTRVEYGDDSAGRIIGLRNLQGNDDVIASYAYTLDENGNIISENAVQPLEPLIQPETVTYVYGMDNRLQTANSVSFTYDQNGNVVTKGDTTYQYDYENHLKTVTGPEGTWEYRYDGLGNRIGLKHNGNERRFLLDPRGMTYVLAEYDGNGDLIAYYIYGLGLVYKVDAADNPYYYHYNFTGHTVAMTDANGDIVNKYAYTPFGILADSEETVPNPFRYAGKFGVMDDENGLLYMRARYYDFDGGRFITKDPIGFAGGVNLYAYTTNPVNWVDPLGLCDMEGDLGISGDLGVSSDIVILDGQYEKARKSLLDDDWVERPWWMNLFHGPFENTKFTKRHKDGWGSDEIILSREGAVIIFGENRGTPNKVDPSGVWFYILNSGPVGAGTPKEWLQDIGHAIYDM